MFRNHHETRPSPSRRIMGKIVCRDPVVTISKCSINEPLGIVDLNRKLFRRKGALHIISHTYNSHRRKRLRFLEKELKRLSKYLVDNHFVYLCNTLYESWLLSRYNIPSFQSSELISLDESVFSPEARPLPHIEPAEAVYVGRLVPRKRHELASALRNLALVYGCWGSDPDQQYEKMKQEHPAWRFINHEWGDGRYYLLDNREVAGVLNACHVGLCLSAEEGAMRASMEYLMCGLPVVTTRNIGGRDRYFDDDNCIFAEDTPEAVAAAVRETLARNPDRREIRRTVLEKVNFDRANFVVTINDIINSIYDRQNLFESYTPFIAYMDGRPVKDVMDDLATL